MSDHDTYLLFCFSYLFFSVVSNANNDYASAVALFNFSSQNPDELPISENEELSILLGQCDEEGWLMAINSKGERGYVPENYIEFRSTPGQPVQHQESFDRASIQHQVSYLDDCALFDKNLLSHCYRLRERIFEIRCEKINKLSSYECCDFK